MAQAFLDEITPDKVLNERVVDFLYILLRDEILPGDLEAVIQNFVEKRDESNVSEYPLPGGEQYIYPPLPDDKANVFSNKGLEQYARELAERLHAWVPPIPTQS